ncbi:hypothetical protein C1H46_001829 [Malus baccata]|uniref:Uncharacterized protein n=1 Tax=Malus baccata TaxID=106549 RepID=A0A540NNJ6_MALBA|nr:hypothetical protein C1H46_001829 [Malus baccata]
MKISKTPTTIDSPGGSRRSLLRANGTRIAEIQGLPLNADCTNFPLNGNLGFLQGFRSPDNDR